MKQRYTILITNTGETYACDEQQDVLRAMEALGRRGAGLPGLSPQ